MMNNDEVREKIINKLDEKKISCSLCATDKFVLLDSFLNISIQKEIPDSLIIGGPTLPSAILICKNCGNSYLINLKVLGPNNE